MAYAATLTWNSGTINLNDGSVYTLMEYTPRSNEIGVPDVQDTIRIKVEGTSTGAVGSACGSIEKALRGAQEYQERRAGAPGYFYYQADGYTSVYFSQIMEKSRFEIEEPYMFNFTNNRAVFGNIYLNRENFWRGPQKAFTDLQNPNGTGDIGTVFNSNDGTTVTGGKRYAYVDVPGSSIAGDLPSPILLQYANDGGTALEKLYVFNQIYQGTSFNPNIDTSAFATAYGTIIGTSDYANYSGGSARTYGIGSVSMALFAQATITPTSPVPEHMAIMLAANSGATSSVYIRADLVSNNITLQTGLPTQLTGDYHQILDVFKVPPTNVSGPLEIWLYGQNTAGSTNMVIDNLWTMPIQGGYRQYTIIGTTLGTSPVTGDTLVDGQVSPTYPQIYITTSGPYYYNILVTGDPIHIAPGIANRLWFIREDSNGRNPSSYGGVSVDHWPRRLKI